VARSVDLDDLMMRARRWLGVEELSGTELAARLGVSQPTASRLLRQYQAQILTTGQARRTRYILRRAVADVTAPVPIYEIDAKGASRRIAWLHPVAATRFHVESCCDEVDSATYDDWPWWLHQLRPAGFLGRHVAGLHPDLGLPEEPRSWNGDQVLRYLNHHGYFGSGALIVGEPAMAQWVRSADARLPADVAPRELYPTLVNDVLAGAPPGSSVEGEQPKFLVARTASRPERLVKFSPPITDAVGRRIADLLLAEHHALRALSNEGSPAACSSIVEADERVFLETERFDRTTTGRLGLLALEPFDLQFVGDAGRNRWPQIVKRLIGVERMPESVLSPVQRLHAFGHLIGNDDMHTGNLSFMVRGHRVFGVAPAYDMVPMRFSPLRGELPERELTVAPSSDIPRSIWEWAARVAEGFWFTVAADVRISANFRRLAEQCASRVRAGQTVIRRLPE
jgi:DNA-binding transcriptional ArsR family regulator